MRRLLLAVPLALALLTAPAAHAGGFATVGLSSTPEGVAPGTPWRVDVTLLQHGRTPLAGVHPVVVIRSGDVERRFPAAATGKRGVYRAEVVFPTAGRWRYEVLDGFVMNQRHTFPPATIGGSTRAAAPAPAPAQAPPSGSTVELGWLAPGILALLAAGAVLLWSRRSAGAPA